MIIDVWRPRFTKINGKKMVSHLEMCDIDLMINDKKTGWTIRYICDTCGNKSNTISKVFFNKETKLNTLEHQTCRSCRTRISEYEIKKTQIPYDKLLESFTECDYKLLIKEEDYNTLPNKSQQLLPVVCDNNHEYFVTWNNWSKGKRCKVCYEKEKYDNAVKYKYGWDMYKFLVWHHTEKNYKKYKNIINPYNYIRGDEYHLDHKYSMYEGFNEGILPSIIGSYKNLEVIPSGENLSKNKKCSITKKQLFYEFEFNH